MHTLSSSHLEVREVRWILSQCNPNCLSSLIFCLRYFYYIGLLYSRNVLPSAQRAKTLCSMSETPEAAAFSPELSTTMFRVYSWCSAATLTDHIYRDGVKASKAADITKAINLSVLGCSYIRTWHSGRLCQSPGNAGGFFLLILCLFWYHSHSDTSADTVWPLAVFKQQAAKEIWLL